MSTHTVIAIIAIILYLRMIFEVEKILLDYLYNNKLRPFDETMCILALTLIGGTISDLALSWVYPFPTGNPVMCILITSASQLYILANTKYLGHKLGFAFYLFAAIIFYFSRK